MKIIPQDVAVGNVLRLHRSPQNRLKLSGMVEQRRRIIFAFDRALLSCSLGSSYNNGRSILDRSFRWHFSDQSNNYELKRRHERLGLLH
jgi:hypothetical protein